MIIRPFDLNDQASVIDLWSNCGSIAPQNKPEKDIQRKLEVNPDLFLVGEVINKQQKTIVASVMGGYEGHRGWINYLAVSPNAQRQGYAKRMMQAIEDRLSECGCPKINLQIRSSNREVKAFYESIGYVLDDVISMGRRLEVD